MHDKTEYAFELLKSVRPFNELPDDVLETLSESLLAREYRRDEEILRVSQKNDSLFILDTGAVDILNSDDELEDRLNEKACFGFDSTLQQPLTAESVVALEPCRLYVMEGAVFRQLCSQYEDVRDYFEMAASQRLNKALKQLKSTHFNFNARLATPVESTIKRDAVCADENLSITKSVQKMASENVSCLMLVNGEGQLSGLLTDKDIRNRVVAAELDGHQPVNSVMSRKIIKIKSNTMAFEASLLMMRHNIHHLPVVVDKKPVGLISTTDLMRLSNQSPVYTISEIAKADTISELVEISSNIPDILCQLVDSGLAAYQVGQVISALGENINIRLLELAESKFGPPPVDYCWMVAGSLGRREQLLHSDQDNALIVSDEYDEARHGDYFRSLTAYVSDGLNECGYVYCPGNVMATNPRWCQPLSQWQDYFSKWINEPQPKALMYCSIFFDMRVLFGKRKLFKRLKKHYLQLSMGNRLFLALLSGNALQNTPPLGFFRQMVLINDKEHKNRLNLKNRGTAPIVDLARVYTLSAGLKSNNTYQRLLDAKKCGEISKTVGNNLLDAYEFINMFRMQHQAKQIAKQVDPDNFADPDRLSRFERDHLHDAFKIVAEAQDYLVQRYSAGHRR